MRPLEKGPCPTDSNGKSIQVNDYKDWRTWLVDRIGNYCVYCNDTLHYNLNVEHVVALNPPVGYSPGALLDWNNVLLACFPCNNKKDTQVINYTTHYFPEHNNTHLPFDVSRYSGFGLICTAKQKGQNNNRRPVRFKSNCNNQPRNRFALEI
jgi:HNH endonuclease